MTEHGYAMVGDRQESVQVLRSDVLVDVPLAVEHTTASGILVPASSDMVATVKVLTCGPDVSAHILVGSFYIMKRNKGTRLSKAFGCDKTTRDLRVVPESELLAQVVD